MLQILHWKHPAIASRIAVAAFSLALAAPQADAKTIAAVMHSDLRVIDPGFTTAYITRDHGYMVYDTLLAEDSNFKNSAANGRLESFRRQAHLHVYAS